MTERTSVLIIGAGIVGVATARALATAGRRVLVVDRGIPWGEASAASAGMLAPQIEAHAGDALLPLGLAARERYASIASECARDGYDIGYRATGIVHIAFTEQSETALKAQHDAQRALGLDTAWLYARELRSLHPGIVPHARGGLLAPRDGSVDSVALGEALVASARKAGVTFVTDAICEITSKNGRVTGASGAQTSYEAESVVLAAGAWATGIAGMPRNVPVEPVRGQLAAMPWPEGEPRCVLFGDAGYLVPRGNEAIVGSTMEHTGFEKGTTEEGLAHLRAQAAALLPALDGVPLTRAWSGLRPMTPDTLPIIGFDPELAGLVYATGHGRNGILLGPITGDIVADLLVRGKTAWDIAPYTIARFGR